MNFSLARNPLDQIPTTQLYSLRASLVRTSLDLFSQ
jgi:hypothetical protein